MRSFNGAGVASSTKGKNHPAVGGSRELPGPASGSSPSNGNLETSSRPDHNPSGVVTNTGAEQRGTDVRHMNAKNGKSVPTTTRSNQPAGVAQHNPLSISRRGSR